MALDSARGRCPRRRRRCLVRGRPDVVQRDRGRQPARSIIRSLAEEAGLREPDQFAHSWHILMKGSIVAAGEGDRDAAGRAQAMGSLLIEQYR